MPLLHIFLEASEHLCPFARWHAIEERCQSVFYSSVRFFLSKNLFLAKSKKAHFRFGFLPLWPFSDPTSSPILFFFRWSPSHSRSESPFATFDSSSRLHLLIIYWFRDLYNKYTINSFGLRFLSIPSLVFENSRKVYLQGKYTTSLGYLCFSPLKKINKMGSIEGLAL